MKKEKECNHKGFWKSIGVSGTPGSMTEYSSFKVAIFCSNCGKIKSEDI